MVLAIAMALFHPYTAMGKLKAVMTPTIPRGFQFSIRTCPGRSEGSTDPPTMRDKPTAKSQMSTYSWTSPTPSGLILPEFVLRIRYIHNYPAITISIVSNFTPTKVIPIQFTCNILLQNWNQWQQCHPMGSFHLYNIFISNWINWDGYKQIKIKSKLQDLTDSMLIILWNKKKKITLFIQKFFLLYTPISKATSCPRGSNFSRSATPIWRTISPLAGAGISAQTCKNSADK